MTIKIDKGVPLPPVPAKGGAGRKPKYPWREMQVGDSFFAASDKKLFSTTKAGQSLNMKFATRKTEENGVRGFRVWRIA